MEAFWQRFEADSAQRDRRLRGRRAEPVCSGTLLLSEGPRENDRMLTAVLQGRRTARIDSLEHLQKQGRQIMSSNEHFILMDSSGNPRAVIRTTGAHFTPYHRMKEEWVLLEGTGETFASWQARWRQLLSQEARAKGVALSLETMMVVETFTVVYRE